MTGDVVVLEVPERPTAVIAATTTWAAFPRLWRELLDEVWPVVRRSGSIEPGRNVMLYLDDTPRVEVGVEVAGPFEPIGRVVCSALPAGRVATTTFRGRYEHLGDGHRAVIDACAQRGLRRVGPRWEIYDHYDEASDDQGVEIYWLVEEPRLSSETAGS